MLIITLDTNQYFHKDLLYDIDLIDVHQAQDSYYLALDNYLLPHEESYEKIGKDYCKKYSKYYNPVKKVKIQKMSNDEPV